MKINIIIYTDGACRGNQYDNNVGAWASLIFIDKLDAPRWEISDFKKNTTNNRMELTACIRALELVSKNFKKEKIQNIDIFTDSAYISNCFKQKWYIKWEKNSWRNSKKKPVENKDLWEKLIKLYRYFGNVKFNHVRGHVGNKWNEKVDLLANKTMDKKI